MSKTRLEAFSDGVLAIVITIMVLELRAPHGSTLESLKPLVPIFASYVLSFLFVGIYWNNHHHLLQVVERIDGPVLWANLHLLFWLSLTPFVMHWLGDNGFAPLQVALYGGVLLMAGVAFWILVRALLRLHPHGSALRVAIGDDRKGNLSLLIYAVGIALAFVNRWLAIGCYALVVLIWIVPDRRVERALHDARTGAPG